MLFVNLVQFERVTTPVARVLSPSRSSQCIPYCRDRTIYETQDFVEVAPLRTYTEVVHAAMRSANEYKCLRQKSSLF